MVTMSRCAKILAAGELVLADDIGKVLRLLEHIGRKLVRDVVLANDDFDVDAEVVGTAQDLDDAADGRIRRLREIRESRR